MLEFKTIDQTLHRLDNTTPVANSQNYLYANFTLPEGTDSAIAYFSIIVNGQVYGTQVEIVDGQCMVPDPVIKQGIMYVGLTLQTGEELITTTVQSVRIIGSAIDSGTLPDLPDEQPNQYLEFIRMYNEIMAGGGGGSSVTDSTTNGNILVNGSEVNVYTLPSDVAKITALPKIQTATYTATSSVTNIPHNLSYVPSTDFLEVLYQGIIMDIGDNYTENANNISVDLVGWNLTVGEKISFRLYKNVK